MEKLTLALSGGGTGGHFYPLLAFLSYVLERKAFKEVLFFGDRKGIEYRKRHLLKVDRAYFSNFRKFKGSSLLGKLFYLFATSAEAVKISSTLKRKSFVSLTFGGYTSVPLGLVSALKKRPLFIHEQNAVPGSANRALSKFAKKVFLTFPDSGRFFKTKKVEVVGLPIRGELKVYKKRKREEVLKELGWEDKFTLLLLGGSQGAKAINKLALKLVPKLEEIRVIHICGEKNFENVKREYEKLPLKVELKLYPFVEEIGRLLRVSDFAISRAGASTAMELAFFGIPTLFVPYPYAIYDHQYYNATYFVKGGGAFLFREEELDLSKVLGIVKNLAKDKSELKQRSEAMERLFIPDAEKKILNSMLSII